ncbi:helix-turn-helix transcriptional regulator [Cellulosimicrobium sp. ES-005]|uniref:Helix-turn-helix transcriptional regulator n=1 Tax=Cellulosimicrobium sp. ES-005 TaxID=3163031 RepID=A0AAU8FYI9_9MICO
MTTSVREDYSPVSVPEFAVQMGQTSSGVLKTDGSVASGVATSLSQRIAEIRALVGLTTDQVGRLFGVSRRSVHNWINGNAMAPHHEERAAAILAIVQALPGSTPEERRYALLDSSSGASLFHQLIATRGEAVRLQVAGVSAKERIGL